MLELQEVIEHTMVLPLDKEACLMERTKGCRFRTE